MRKPSWAVVAMVLVSRLLWAGGAPRGDRRDRGNRGRGVPWGAFNGPTRTDIFDAARKTIDLTDEARTDIDELRTQFDADLQAAIDELRRKLSKDYAALIKALLPAAEQPKYEAVVKALTERDETLAAAQKELKATLKGIKEKQGADRPRGGGPPGRGGRPNGSIEWKGDVALTHFVLDERQHRLLDAIRRENFDTTRRRMGEVFAQLRDRGGPPDPNAYRQAGQAIRQVREQIDDETATFIAAMLTPEQKKDYAEACAAIDACRNKTKAAEQACRKQVAAAVGEDKASALLGPPPAQTQQPATAPKPKKATEF